VFPVHAGFERLPRQVEEGPFFFQGQLVSHGFIIQFQSAGVKQVSID
jgi:hypothetical protein